MNRKTSNDHWREKLSAEEFRVLREKGTERAFSGAYDGETGPGEYVCRGCGELLFDSDAKFDSGSGWPSFTSPIEGTNVLESEDRSHGMLRTEVSCGNCDGHLGHVFSDGPAPGEQRYCINSASLRLNEREE
ncbi:MAG: peptide-methionine (R)-S-oxide reductase MsrB [Kofleriaceae bacterium]|nr:peptide-methionine (R)-S-oxide reductase MsrB [Kofleriaceae bacterium]